MFERLRSLTGIGTPKVDHPLADLRALRRIVGEIPASDSFRALDEIAGWLESTQNTADFPAGLLYEVASQLDDAAQAHTRKLARDYLHTPRLSRTDERRLWAASHDFWIRLAATYERCLAAVDPRVKGGESLKKVLPGLCARAIAALGNVLKWEQFHYSMPAGALWRRLGAVLLMAEAGGVASSLVQIRGYQQGMTSPQQEFVRLLALQAASIDSLQPLEIEVAERLIAHFQPGFVFSEVLAHDSVYWVDLALDQPPVRLARLPPQARPTQRFFKPAAAHARIAALLQELERGGEVPGEINLGGHYPAGALIPVLRHLATYLAPIPPQRRSSRHNVEQRALVVNGLPGIMQAYSGKLRERNPGMGMESWVVENVSRGGLGVVVNRVPAEWLKVGALVTLQPEGSDTWQLGIVRRYRRHGEAEAHVGIETLSLRARPAELRKRATSGYAAVSGIAALLIPEGCHPGELRALMPVASFDLRETLEFDHHGKRESLSPVAMIERGDDFELALYRVAASA